jgi:hypothetical protein
VIESQSSRCCHLLGGCVLTKLRALAEQLAERGCQTQTILIQSNTDPESTILDEVDNANLLVAIVSKDSLKQPAFTNGMIRSKKSDVKIIVIHDATTCFFPSLSEQPENIREFFVEKAITYLTGNVTYYIRIFLIFLRLC